MFDKDEVREFYKSKFYDRGLSLIPIEKADELYKAVSLYNDTEGLGLPADGLLLLSYIFPLGKEGNMEEYIMEGYDKYTMSLETYERVNILKTLENEGMAYIFGLFLVESL